MSMYRRLRKLFIGDSVSNNISRQEYEEYEKIKKEIERKQQEEDQKLREQIRAEIIGPEISIEEREEVLEKGPPFLRWLWWKIVDKIALLKRLSDYLPLFATILCVISPFYVLYCTGLVINFIYSLFLSMFFGIFPWVIIWTGKIYNGKESFIVLAFIFGWLYAETTGAVAPISGYFGIVTDKKGIVHVEDYRKIKIIKDPIEYAKKVEYYWLGSQTLYFLSQPKINSDNLKINSSLDLDVINNPSVEDIVAATSIKDSIHRLICGQIDSALNEMNADAIDLFRKADGLSEHVESQTIKFIKTSYVLNMMNKLIAAKLAKIKVPSPFKLSPDGICFYCVEIVNN